MATLLKFEQKKFEAILVELFFFFNIAIKNVQLLLNASSLVLYCKRKYISTQLVHHNIYIKRLLFHHHPMYSIYWLLRNSLSYETSFSSQLRNKIWDKIRLFVSSAKISYRNLMRFSFL